MSPSARELLGWNPEQLVGRPSSEFYHPEDVMTFCALGVEQPDDVGSSVIRRVSRIDGSYIWLDSRARSFRVPTVIGRS